MSATRLRSRRWSSTASHRADAGRTVRSPSTSPWAEAVEQRGPCGAGHNGPPSRTHAMLDTIERETGPSPRHSVIWLHGRSEEHTSELQSLMRISYAVFCLKKKKQTKK